MHKVPSIQHLRLYPVYAISVYYIAYTNQGIFPTTYILCRLCWYTPNQLVLHDIHDITIRHQLLYYTLYSIPIRHIGITGILCVSCYYYLAYTLDIRHRHRHIFGITSIFTLHKLLQINQLWQYRRIFGDFQQKYLAKQTRTGNTQIRNAAACILNHLF